ncbi:MAG: teichoic acid transport system permease protein [Actinomycetota bacterium]|jgi:teichoic acid transport system permease protein|nr:teichoic acid transport system permease protein [Actinomycetota bacterium]
MAVAQPYREATVYESTASGLPQLRPYLTDLWGRRRFIWHLARTDLKAEHYDSAIGQVWVVLDPLLMAAVYFLLRTVVRPSGNASARSAIIAHLVWAVFFFTFVSNAMQTGARSLLSGRNLILNASFPRAVLPLVSIVKSVFDFLPTMLVYFAFHAVLGQPFGLSLIMLPVVILILTLMNIGLAMLFAPLMVFFRDTSGFLPYINRIWLYITPALFLISEIPPKLLAYLRWNPLFPSFAALEQIFNAQFPSAAYLFAGLAWAVGFFLVGAIVFLAREREFAVRL